MQANLIQMINHDQVDLVLIENWKFAFDGDETTHIQMELEYLDDFVYSLKTGILHRNAVFVIVSAYEKGKNCNLCYSQSY